MNNNIQLVLKSSTAEMSLNDHDAGIYLVPDMDGLVGLPEIRTTSGVNAGYDGGWTSAQNFDARSITLRGVIANTDVATVERMRKQLISLLAEGKNEQLTLDLVTEAGNAYELQVRTIACDMALQRVLTKQEFMIQLRADDPLIYDNSAGSESVIVQVQRALGGFTIDFELPLAISGGQGDSTITNAGLEKVYPVVKMYGALHNPVFVNQTTNQQIQINTDLSFAEGMWHTPSELYEGVSINIPEAPNNAPLASFRLDGKTSQNGTPTPSAPVAVNTTTGENVVEICGKNLFELGTNLDDYFVTNIDGTKICSNQSKDFVSATLTGTKWTTVSYNTSGWRWCSKWVELAKNTNYTITTTNSATNIRVVGFASKEINTTGTSIARMTSGIATFNSGDYAYYAVSIYPNTAGSVYENIQLELGSSASSFEPYQSQSYGVNLASKNLLDITTLTYGYVLNDGGFSSNHPLGEMRSGYIKVAPSTKYTFSIVETSSSYESWLGIGEYSANGSGFIVRKTLTTSGATSITFTTSANCQYVVLSARNLESATKVQFEKGLSPTSWEAFWQIELCKIGTYQDYIYKSGDKWYVHKALGRQNVDTSGITLNSSYSNVEYCGINKSSDYVGYGNYRNNPIWCSHATYAYAVPSGWNTADNIGKILPTANSSQYWLGFTKGTGLDNIKAALAGCIIYYPLATPTDTEITNQALITQLDALLNNARTYAGVNNIFTVTPNEQGTLEITYYTERDADKRDELIIDSRMRTATLNGADVYHLIAAGSEFPMLAPGENKLMLRSDIPGDNGYAEVNYKQGYLSI